MTSEAGGSHGILDEEAAVVNAFLRNALDDRQRGGLRQLSDYVQACPVFSTTIAREYAVFRIGLSDCGHPPGAIETALDAALPSPASSSDPVVPASDSVAAQIEDDIAEAADFARRVAGESYPGTIGGSGNPGPGDRFGSYRIVDEIGRGGQGVVFLAEDLRLGRTVALKLLYGRDPEFGSAFARFRREAETASKLDHPGICTVYEAGITEGVFFIAMRRLEGETLARKFERERHSGIGHPDSEQVIEVLRLVEEAARALHFAHEAGIVHRDVKPGNIIITPQVRPVLVDFGLARNDAGGATVTVSGEALGTPAYVSPEQLGPSRPVRIDRRTDVWSLGVVLYEGVCGRRPFESATREGLYRMILSEAPPDPRRLNPRVSREFKVVLETALEKERDRRYRTAELFAEDLRRVREREPILAKPPGPATRALHWIQRRPATAAALALLVVGTLISTRLAVLASANLAEWGRLADARRIDDLILEADGPLWPSVPSKIPQMERWLLRARAVFERLPEHDKALTDLRKSARPYTDEERAADRASHRKELEMLAHLGSQRDERRDALSSFEDSASAWSGANRRHTLGQRLDTAEATLDATHARLEPVLSERLTWSFEDPVLQWRHDKLSDLVRHLWSFSLSPATEPGLESVEQRLEFARTLRQRTVDDHAAAWANCLERVATNPRYAPGTLTAPLTGLIPLGPDPASRLEEFYETMTGHPAVRNRETGRIEVTEDTALILVLLPGGLFTMGAQGADRAAPNYDPHFRRSEGPPHSVELAPYFLSKFEMTQGQYLRATSTNPSYHAAATALLEGRTFDLRNPVETVNWEDCRRVSFRLGLSLPTEAQWEFACRAGTDSPWPVGFESSQLAGAANLADRSLQRSRARGGPPTPGGYEPWEDGYAKPAPVGQFAANGFGLHDMIGNVLEWCADSHVAYSKKPRPVDGLRLWPGVDDRVIRGGAFDHRATHARSATRVRNPPSFAARKLGLRPARATTP